MANPYYTNTPSFSPGTTAKGSEVDAKFEAVEAGFDGVDAHMDQAIRVTSPTGSEFITQTPGQRANKTIGFDGSGNVELKVTTASEYRGDWATATDYAKGDMVKDAAGAVGLNNLYIAITAHTSTDLASDIANWSLAVDVTDVAASEAAAASSASAASSSASNAATSASQALGYRNEAETFKDLADGYQSDALGYSLGAEQSYTDTVAVAASIGGKNLLVNGQMRWNQRYAGALYGKNEYTLDQWFSGTLASGTVQISQIALSPGDLGITNEPQYALRWYHSEISGLVHYIEQPIEDVRSAIGKVTLSFWVRRSASGTETGLAVSLLQKFDGSATVAISPDSGGPITTPLAFNVWEKHSRTFTLPSIAGKTIGADSALIVRFANGNTTGTCQFDITNVQLEMGEIATEYDNIGESIDLMRCKRYFQKSWDADVQVGTVTYQGAMTWSLDNADAVNRLSTGPQFPVTMRVTPTVTMYNPNTGASGTIYGSVGSVINYTPSPLNTSQQQPWGSMTTTPDLATGEHVVRAHWVAGAEL